MEIKDRIEILSNIERLFGMMSIFSDVIRAECYHRDDDSLEHFRENSFDSMYGEIENIRTLIQKPFQLYQLSDL